MRRVVYEAELKEDFTLEDFRQVIMRCFGGVNKLCFVVGMEQLDLANEAGLNSTKHLIRDMSTVYILQRMCGGCCLADTSITLSNRTKAN